jgi:PAS domain S-box-containing protein
MGEALVSNPFQSLYALGWTYAQDGKLAVDLTDGTVMDANPAFEKMVGYSRKELIGRQVLELHPEAERELARIEMNKDFGASKPSIHSGFHLIRKDGQLVPVQIWTSESLTFNGHEMAIGEFRDITNRLRYQLEASVKNWALSAFSSAALALSRADSEHELLQAICEAITNESAYVLAFVSVAQDDAEKSVRFAAASGKTIDYLDGLRLSWAEDDPDGQGLSGICIRTGQIHILDDFETAPRFARWRDRARNFGVRSIVGIPLSIEGGWKGALIVFSAESGAFDAEPVQVFKRLGEQIVHGVEALRHKQLLESERQELEIARRHLTDVLAATVGAMVTAMEARDPYTAGHESRVADICVAIGREMGWDEGRLLGMRLGAMVHDVGKISIPAQILTKPSRLGPAEFAIVKEHPETGHNILKGIPFTWPIADMVRQHHEKLDGSGYPLGIKGDEILLESRVLGVADMVEAMASDRPYRRARGLEFALHQIESEAGTLLDPEVVRICAALFREKRLVVPGLNWI